MRITLEEAPYSVLMSTVVMREIQHKGVPVKVPLWMVYSFDTETGTVRQFDQTSEKPAERWLCAPDEEHTIPHPECIAFIYKGNLSDEEEQEKLAWLEKNADPTWLDEYFVSISDMYVKHGTRCTTSYPARMVRTFKAVGKALAGQTPKEENK